jgi:hypothetical protein
VILAGFVLGLSTRKVGEALLALLGRLVSASTVSQVAKTLDAAVAAFHRRPLQNRYQALMLDGVVLSRKSGCAGQFSLLWGCATTARRRSSTSAWRRAKAPPNRRFDRAARFRSDRTNCRKAAPPSRFPTAAGKASCMARHGVISAGAQMPESLVASTWRLRRLLFSNHFCYGTPYLAGPIPIY